MKINDVTLSINENLKDVFSKYPGIVFHGIAETVLKKQGTVEMYMPALFLDSGDYQYVGIDNTFTMIGYHKLNRLSTSFQLNSVKSYGRKEGIYTNNYSLSLFLYYDRKKIKLFPDEVYLKIISALQNGMKIKGFNSVIARINEVILNSQQVFQKEYKGVDFKLPVEKSILEIGYTVEGTFDKDCLDNCRC